MTLLYNGVDITPSVTVSGADLVDSAGGKFDSVELEFSDTAGRWSQWKPALGDTVRLICDGFDTGTCYIDGLGQRRGLFLISALSAPVEAKEPRSRSWERVRLSELIQDCASRYGFSVEIYGMTDPWYAWVDQHELPDFEFLARRCALEGAQLKVNNGKVIVWSEAMLEEMTVARKISAQDFCGSPNYTARGDLYRTVTVYFDGISGSFTAPVADGMDLTVSDVYVSNVAEAQRFAAGIARQRNGNAETIVGSVMLDMSIAGGTVVEVTGFGAGDGIYIVDEVEHRIGDRQSDLVLRKRLKGY